MDQEISQKGKNGGARPGAGRPKGSRNKRHRRHAQRTQVEFQAQGSGYTGEALALIIRGLRADDCPWPVKINAAFRLIENVYGRPPQRVQVAMRGLVEHKVYGSEAEYREALLAMGVHPTLLPALMPPKALSGPPGPPPPLPDDDDVREDGRPDPGR
jgi:hypothetical protein